MVTVLQVASFVNADSWREIVFTRNASEAVNLVAHAWGTANLKPGDEVSHACLVWIAAASVAMVCRYLTAGMIFSHTRLHQLQTAGYSSD